jgi:hypothetical protein
MPGFNIDGAGDGPEGTVDVLRQYRWEIQQLGPISDRIVRLLAREMVLPESKIDTQEVLGGLLYYKYAKSVKWENISVTFYDTTDTLKELIAWRDKIYTNQGGIKIHSRYKLDSIFLLQDGLGATLKTITAKGSWPVSIAQGQLSYASSDAKIITVTLAYDYAEVT